MKTCNFTTDRPTEIFTHSKRLDLEPWEFDQFTQAHVEKNYERPELFITNLADHFHELPPREQEVIQLYYYDKLTQRQIAKKINRTQGAVSACLSKARRRLKFLVLRKEMLQSNCKHDLSDFFGKIDIALIISMFQTCSITTTMRALKNAYPEYRFSFSIVRGNWSKIRRKLKKHGVRKYSNAAEFVNENLGILSDFYYLPIKRGSHLK